MNRWAYVAVGVLAYLIALIATAPASLVAKAAAKFGNGAVSMASARGSVWRGGARLYIGRGTESRPFGDIAWRVAPLRLLTGQLRSHIKVIAPDGDLDATVSFGIGQMSLRNFRAAFPAELVSKAYPPGQLLGPQGAVRIEGSEFDLGRASARGRVSITWRDAGSHMTSVQPLGDYRLQASGRGAAIGLELQTLKGSLNVSGRGEWRLVDGSLQFNGLARPAARAAELEPLLKALGPDQGGGQRAIAIAFPPATR